MPIMWDNSFTSIIILLILFIVLPSVLKFIGQYTLASKNAADKGNGHEMDDTVPDNTGSMEEYPSESPENFHYRQPISNRPIHPKWF